MERFVESLYKRLEGKPEKQMKLIGIMDSAINEMQNNGVFSSLPESLQEQIHSEDPTERVTIKASIAKDIAVQSFIRSSKPLVLQNGDPAHMIFVKFDPRFIHSIALCIQGGLEGLYLSGVYKQCEDERMYYYIQTDAAGADYANFRMKMLEVESLYDCFQINVMPPLASAAASQNSAASQNTAASPSKAAQEKADVKATGAETEKKSFWKKLFKK